MDGGVITNLRDEGLVEHLMTFTGAIMIDSDAGNGFLVTDNGNLVAAYYAGMHQEYRGKLALAYLTGDAAHKTDPQQKFSLRSYDPTDFTTVMALCEHEGLLVSDAPAARTLPPTQKFPPVDQTRQHTLIDEAFLKKVLAQPGVIAVSVFFEGFPVQSLGDADFEHVAALAEDLMRAGARIAQDMKIGNLNQLILETADNKFIIAPCGDLFLCVFTRADAQLGLIRVILKSIQLEVHP